MVRYRFEWDLAKDAANVHKHGVAFRTAATVFRDPNQLTVYDEEHSLDEDRWVTIGIDASGVLLVVVHTHSQVDKGTAEIRIISVRRATRREAHQYEETVL